MEPFCTLPWVKIKVQASGLVSNCCFQKTIGNLLETPLATIWNSPLQQKIREAILERRLHPNCDQNNCPFKYEQLTAPTEDLKRITSTLPPMRRGPLLKGGDKLDLPNYIELDLPNTWCNVGGPIPTKERPACFMCPRSGKGFHPDGERYEKVLEAVKVLAPNLKQLMIVGLGEIFWKDQLWKIFDKIGYSQYKNEIEFGSFSNATCLNPERQTRFLASCPNLFLSISIDAAQADTYQKLRSLPLYDTVIKNTKNLLLHPDRKKIQRISPCYNINMINIDEVEDMVKMWKGYPVSSVLFSPTHDCFAEYDNGLYNITVNEKNWRKFTKARDLIQQIAKEEKIPARIFNRLEMDYEVENSDKLRALKVT